MQQLVGILLWIAGALVTMVWAYGIRSHVRTGQGVSQQTVNQTMMFAISLIIVPIFGLSPFHLLWMFLLVLHSVPSPSCSLFLCCQYLAGHLV